MTLPRPIVSVVIGTLDRFRYLQCVIASVREELPPHEAEIIVIDGGSQDGTLEWLDHQEDVITLVQRNRGERNGRPILRRSWGHFMNLGFKRASAPSICMLSDDCLVVPGAIRNGLPALEQDEVGAVAFYWRSWPIQRPYRVGLTFGGRVFVNHGLLKREALAAVGYVDEDAFHFYYADADLALRMSEAGWRCVDSPNSYVEHHPYANRALTRKNAWIARDDRPVFERRWAHLGRPDRGCLVRSHVDPHQTARRWWGRRPIVTSWLRRAGDELPRRLIRAPRRAQ